MIYCMEKAFFQEYLARRLRAENQVSEEVLSRTLSSGEPAQLYQVINGDARIPIHGVLGNRRSFFDILFGIAPLLTYDELISAVHQADEDPQVRRIIFDINSPGGRVDGLDDAAQAIAAVKKPTVARVRDMAASGGYWLASQADRIEVTSPVATVGSIGVLATVLDDKERLAMMGFKEIIIVSTDSPRKYVDPVTEAGQKEIREVLDGIHRVFLKRVAEGRKAPLPTVTESFGKGALIMATLALAVGMIDKIVSGYSPTDSSGNSAQEPNEANLKAFREKIRKIG